MLRLTCKERKSCHGFTLLEMVVTSTILAVLAMAVVPVAYQQVQRQKEKELRRALWEIRDAIDRYKDLADKSAFQIKADSNGFPPDLESLVKGVELANGVKFKFLRRIPKDPITNSTEWGLRSNQDDADSTSWGGQAVFDVYTKSDKKALDGTKYKDW